jgi:hypothetical protein
MANQHSRQPLSFPVSGLRFPLSFDILRFSMKSFLLALRAIFRSLFGLDYLPHARATGAVILVNLSGYQWGVEADETGINIESFSSTYKPEQKEYLRNKSGTKIGFAVDDVEAEITAEGEVSGSTGLMAATFATAVTLANDNAEFGLSAGGVYLDEAAISQGRSAFRKASFKFTKNKGIA